MYCMISMLGTIMTACFFMPSIIVSMFPGSNGLAGSVDSASGLRYSPDARALAVLVERARYCSGCRGERGADWRRSWERPSPRLLSAVSDVGPTRRLAGKASAVVEGDVADSLLAHSRLGLLLRCTRHEHGHVVPQDTDEHHDRRDGDEDPVLSSVLN